MADSKKLQILIDAQENLTKELNKALLALNSFGKKADQETKKAKKGFDSSKSSVDEFIGTIKGLGALRLVRSLGGLYAIREIGQFFLDAAKSFEEFESSMSNVSTIIDTNVESMDKMKQELLDISTEVPVAIADLTDALYDIRSAGIDAANAMPVLKNSAMLAVAGLGTTKEAADLVTSAINAFNLTGEDANNVFGQIFNTVKQGKTTITALAQGFGAVAGTIANANINLDSYLASVAALTTTGLPAAQAHTQIRAAVAALIRDTTELNEVYTKLRVENFKELIDRNSGDMVKAFSEVAKAVGYNDAQLIKILGSVEGYNAVINLSTTLQGKYQEALSSSATANDELLKAFLKQKNITSAQMQIAMNEWEAFKIKVGGTISYLKILFINFASAVIDTFTVITTGSQLAGKMLAKYLIEGFVKAIAGFKELGNYLVIGVSKIKELFGGEPITFRFDTEKTLGLLDNLSTGMSISISNTYDKLKDKLLSVGKTGAEQFEQLAILEQAATGAATNLGNKSVEASKKAAESQSKLNNKLKEYGDKLTDVTMKIKDETAEFMKSQVAKKQSFQENIADMIYEAEQRRLENSKEIQELQQIAQQKKLNEEQTARLLELQKETQKLAKEVTIGLQGFGGGSLGALPENLVQLAQRGNIERSVEAFRSQQAQDTIAQGAQMESLQRERQNVIMNFDFSGVTIVDKEKFKQDIVAIINRTNSLTEQGAM